MYRITIPGIFYFDCQNGFHTFRKKVFNIQKDTKIIQTVHICFDLPWCSIPKT